MRLQVLASGSKGNCTLVRADELCVLVDAGPTLRTLRPLLDRAGLGLRAVDHVLVTHGHLDHSRSAGALAKREDATVHCAPSLLRHRAVQRAPRVATLAVDGEGRLEGRRGGQLHYRAVPLPHDCDPTVALELRQGDRRAVVLTDMGRPDPAVGRRLRGAHVLVLEFNHDPELLRAGPYTESLKQRIRGGRGHLSNEQARQMLAELAGPELHTLVLAHLSETNNTRELAESAARAELLRLGREDVRLLVADQREPLPELEV